MNDALLQVHDLKKEYSIGSASLSGQNSLLKAVDGVSFSIRAGETLGLVGESGCGKTTTGRAILRLIEPTSGQIIFDGEDLCRASAGRMRRIRRDMQIIFQDPFGSLNPRMTVEKLVSEPLQIHHNLTASKRQERVRNLLKIVGLDAYHLPKYPHEFSGGQRQRIGIARALASNPRFLVCDEPVSALDVSIQSQIINLLRKLQKQRQLTYLFIAHDLSVVKHISDRIAVMYLGRIVEVAPTDDLFHRPLHPYTQALLSAILDPDPDENKARIILTGDLPDATDMPSGCRFHPRCPFCMQVCRQIDPALTARGQEHEAACHLTSGQQET